MSQPAALPEAHTKTASVRRAFVSGSAWLSKCKWPKKSTCHHMQRHCKKTPVPASSSVSQLLLPAEAVQKLPRCGRLLESPCRGNVTRHEDRTAQLGSACKRECSCGKPGAFGGYAMYTDLLKYIFCVL